MPGKNEVVVVGAGVIGLTSALVLAENGFAVTIVAEHFPDGIPNSAYTSVWAGAHFRPFPSINPNDERECAYTRVTLNRFEKLAETHRESSVQFVTGEEYIENANSHYKCVSKGYSEGIDDFQLLDPSKIESHVFPKPIDFACRYRTWVLNPPLYLSFLVRQLYMNYRTRFEITRFNTLKNVFLAYPDAEFIVNATGQGLQMNGEYDPKSYPIRGQTLLVRPPNKQHPYKYKTITHQSADGQWTFVIPRPLDGGVVIGGTKQKYAISDKPDPEDTKEITTRAKILFPELFSTNSSNGKEPELDIIKINVGFRPGRETGSRVEIEYTDDDKRGRFAIHAYGAGGMGFEVSYGVAENVLALAKSKIFTTKKHNNNNNKL